MTVTSQQCNRSDVAVSEPSGIKIIIGINLVLYILASEGLLCGVSYSFVQLLPYYIGKGGVHMALSTPLMVSVRIL